MQKSWIITGCNGYLGGVLCRGLHESGKVVIGVARANRRLDMLKQLGVECHTYDELPGIVKAGDVLVHCAGKTGNVGNREDYEAINVNWSAELFDLASTQGVECFVYISSVAAFGYKNRPGQETLDESSQSDLCEGEIYGQSKLQAEQRLAELAADSATRFVILRAGLIYGRRPVQKSYNWIKRGFTVDTKERVPLVHIDNFQDAVMKVVECSDANGIFIVVDDEQPTRRELNILKQRLNIIRYQPWMIGKIGFRFLRLVRCILCMILRRPARSADYMKAAIVFQSRRSYYNCDHLRTVVGWSPQVSLEDGWREIAEVSSAAGSNSKHSGELR